MIRPRPEFRDIWNTDFRELRDLRELEYPQDCEDFDRSKMRTERRYIRVAHDEDELLGYSLFRIEVKRLVIEQLVSKYKRQGTGTEIMFDLLEQGREMNLTRIQILIPETNGIGAAFLHSRFFNLQCKLVPNAFGERDGYKFYGLIA